MEIIIYKSKKVLGVWEGEKCLHSYSIAIGKASAGHKVREGDMRTPEGEYVVCVKNSQSKYHLSVGINYPNNCDAKRGLEQGLISQEQYEAICRSNDAGDIPPWKTALGGEIYIHGELEKQDWSRGCIRMFNKDIETLFHSVSIGTKVTIKA